jgi:hypothetical protein
VDNVLSNRNILTQRLRIVNSGARKIQNLKFWKAVLILMVLTGIFSLSPAISSLMNNVVINSFGQISTTTAWAKSGYWRDIQDAVNLAAQAGIKNVCIPEGTWNFVNVGETWTNARVVVPAGVSIFGAPTERYANDSVVEWKTILQIPWEAAPTRPNYITMIKFQGNGDPTKPARVSDIKFVGYREFNHTSDTWYSAVQMWNIINFRIDHCCFKHITHQAVNIRAPANGACCGVIDHCAFINDYGYVEWASEECTVGYGVSIRAVGTTRWENDITKVIGQYTNYTVFIEDCYFSRWRHCVCSNDGTHFVFRHNVIEKDSIVGSLDGHGTYDYVGTRAMEIYDNIIIDPVMNKHPENWNSTTPANGQDGITINWRGGGGVFFNNYVRNYKYGVYMTDEGEVQKCYPHDIWIWNNTWLNVQHPTFVSYQGHYYVTENVDYFLRAPNQEQDGFEYTPYPYPHPLTIPQS